MTDETDYSAYPKSIAEERANRSDAGASVWTPRDVLIAILREIDSGKVKPDEVAVIITEDDGTGTSFKYFQRCESRLSLLGLYTQAIADGTRP